MNRRAKNLKAVLTQERERERLERERRRQEREEKMDVDGESGSSQVQDEDLPSCMCIAACTAWGTDLSTDSSIEAPPSVLPPRKYCDITGLEVRLKWIDDLSYLTISQGPYTDPATGLRYHDKSIYELIKGLVRAVCNMRILIAQRFSECWCCQGVSFRERCQSYRQVAALISAALL